jgi:hypothetical protein
MKHLFLMEAERELNEATDWYNAQRRGLGRVSKEEFQAAIRRICSKPESSAWIDANVRLYRIARFPYGIVYHVDSHHIVVIAVMHLHRRPEYWQSRFGPPTGEET